jgi:hypothetical protein
MGNNFDLDRLNQKNIIKIENFIKKYKMNQKIKIEINKFYETKAPSIIEEEIKSFFDISKFITKF